VVEKMTNKCAELYATMKNANQKCKKYTFL